MSYINEASLAWLSEVFSERLSSLVSLEASTPDCLRLSVAGSDLAITFDAEQLVYCRPDSDLPCAAWDAAAEGWQTALTAPLPAPGAEALSSPVMEVTSRGAHVRFDLPGLVYWMLTRQEEVGRRERDKHERFPAVCSHAYLHGYLERPIIDEWFFILRQMVSTLWPGLPLTPSPPVMRVSHDVDAPSRYAFLRFPGLLRTIAGDVLRRREPMGVVRGPYVWLASRNFLHESDPYNTFDWLMDQSDEHGLVSAFYFICGRTNPTKDAAYDLEDSRIRSLLRRIHDRGHEIGLHPSYETFRSPDLIDSEARELRRVCTSEGIDQACWGGRMHFLRWETPTTLYGWEQAGMTYDTTLGYADRPGFRCGTCYEYPAFDPVALRRLNVRVRPLIVMDATITTDRYLGLGSSNAAYMHISGLKKMCKAVGGCFTLLWHNSNLNGPGYRELYQRILSA